MVTNAPDSRPALSVVVTWNAAMVPAILLAGIIGYGVFGMLWQTQAEVAAVAKSSNGMLTVCYVVPGTMEYVLTAIFVYVAGLSLTIRLGNVALIVAGGLHLVGGTLAGFAVDAGHLPASRWIWSWPPPRQ